MLAKGQAVFGIAVGRVIEDTEGDVAQLPTGAAAAAEPGATEARARGAGS